MLVVVSLFVMELIQLITLFVYLLPRETLMENLHSQTYKIKQLFVHTLTLNYHLLHLLLVLIVLMVVVVQISINRQHAQEVFGIFQQAILMLLGLDKLHVASELMET